MSFSQERFPSPKSHTDYFRRRSWCVVWRGEEKGVKKACSYWGKSLLPSAPPRHVEADLAPVEVATGGLSAVFQHWENNDHILTNPSDLCLTSKTLLMVWLNTFRTYMSSTFHSNFIVCKESVNWTMLGMFLQNMAISELNSSSFLKACSWFKGIFAIKNI